VVPNCGRVALGWTLMMKGLLLCAAQVQTVALVRAVILPVLAVAWSLVARHMKVVVSHPGQSHSQLAA